MGLPGPISALRVTISDVFGLRPKKKMTGFYAQRVVAPMTHAYSYRYPLHKICVSETRGYMSLVVRLEIALSLNNAAFPYPTPVTLLHILPEAFQMTH